MSEFDHKKFHNSSRPQRLFRDKQENLKSILQQSLIISKKLQTESPSPPKSRKVDFQHFSASCWGKIDRIDERPLQYQHLISNIEKLSKGIGFKIWTSQEDPPHNP